jgi:TM2 domain-containing membrane protein YozV
MSEPCKSFSLEYAKANLTYTRERYMIDEMIDEAKSETAMVAPSTNISAQDTTVPIPPKNTKFCSSCGAQINEKAEICPKCGVRVAPVPSAALTRDPKSRGVAVLLALFLGGLGAHKFYLGKMKMGFVYLLLCWTLVPSLIALIEAIQMALMSDQKFHAKYG